MSAYIMFFKLVGDSKILNYIMPLLKCVRKSGLNVGYWLL